MDEDADIENEGKPEDVADGGKLDMSHASFPGQARAMHLHFFART